MHFVYSFHDFSVQGGIWLMIYYLGLTFLSIRPFICCLRLILIIANTVRFTCSLFDCRYIFYCISLLVLTLHFLTAHPSPIHFLFKQLKPLLGHEYLALSHIVLHLVLNSYHCLLLRCLFMLNPTWKRRAVEG